MFDKYTSNKKAAMFAGLFALGLGLTTAEAATAPASPAVQSVAVANSDGANLTQVGHRHFNRYYQPGIRFHYRPYRYVPSCGWRKRCWYDYWGVRQCRWINTCRRY